MEQESFCSPFSLSFSLFENHTIAFPVVVPSFPRPSSSLIPFVVLSSTRSSRPSEPASLPSATSSPLVLFRLVLISRSLSTYLYLSASLQLALSAAQTLGHVHKAHRSPAFITRYEIAPAPPVSSPPASSRFTHTYSPRIRSPNATPSRYILANFANVGSRRITHLQQYRLFLHPRAV